MSGKPRRAIIETELGTEAQCSKCRDFWPITEEFYFLNYGKPHSWCKACYREDQIAKGRRSGTGRIYSNHERASA